MLSEILTLNQEFQFEACSNNSECKNLSYIYQIDNEEHIPSFNLPCRLAGDSVRSLFQIAIFDLSVKTVKHEKVRILRDNLVRILSRVYRQNFHTVQEQAGIQSSRQSRLV